MPSIPLVKRLLPLLVLGMRLRNIDSTIGCCSRGNFRRRWVGFLAVAVVTFVPLSECSLTLLLFRRILRFLSLSGGLFFKFLLTRRVLQDRAFNVDLVHKVECVARPLELIVEALGVFLLDKLF